MTSVIVTKTLIKPNKSRDMDFSCPQIVDHLLINPIVLNHNIFLSAIIPCITYGSIRNMNIILVFYCMKVSNRGNNFVDSFKGGNAVYTPTDSTIF